MTREDAKQIAIEAAKARKPVYYTEPFEPHDWVVDAIKRAFDLGFDVGWDESTSRYR